MNDDLAGAVNSKLQDGQIYRWRYRDGVDGSYWCRSCFAIVKNGKLFDTYWHNEQHIVRHEDVDLTFLCDQSWRQIDARQIPYFDRADIADTRHDNNSRAPVYLRPGAQRSESAIADAITQAEEAARYEIRRAQWRLERLQAQRELLNAGRLDEVSL